jgi:hypothetical protein
MPTPNNGACSDNSNPQFVIIFVHSRDINVANSTASALYELRLTAKSDGAFNQSLIADS